MGSLKGAVKSALPAWAERPARKLYSNVMDFRAGRLLRKAAKWRTHGDVLRVAFLAYVPGSWDMQRYVFEEFRSRENVLVDVIVLPNYGNDMRFTKEYGGELEFFKELYPDAIVAYQEDGSLFDLAAHGYDYVFYQSPYDEHYPKAYRSTSVMKHSKVCYIPYAFYGSSAFDSTVGNRAFTRNAYFYFANCEAQFKLQEAQFAKTLAAGIQHFEFLGFPLFERYLSAGDVDRKKILWTPRWSYDEKVGGSHFLEYKDEIIDLKRRNPELSITVRPHPMMFAELRNKGLLSAEGEQRFKEECESAGIALSLDNTLEDDLLGAGILLSDYSSILVPYFATGRPVVYCDGGFELTGTMEELSKGMYIVRSWTEVEESLDDVLSGGDSMKEARKRIVNESIGDSIGASERIADCVIRDYMSSLERACEQ